jgi:hypothetical protein
MIKRVAVRTVAILMVAACASTPRQEMLTRWPPVVKQGHIEIPAPLASQVLALQHALEEEFRRQDCGSLASHFAQSSGEVESWCRQVVSQARPPLEAQFETFYPLGGGVVGSLTLSVDGVTPRSLAHKALRNVWAGPAGAGWRVFDSDKWPVKRGQLVSERAEVFILPEAEWMVASVEVEVQTEGAEVLELALAVRSPGDSGGLRLVEALADGRPSSFRITPRGVAIALNKPSPNAHLSLKYEGEARQMEGWDFIKSTDLVLRGSEGAWLPLLGDGLADFDVTVIHPQAFYVFGQGLRLPPKQRSDGWEESRWQFRGDAFTLYGGSRYSVSQFDQEGLHVTVALWPEHAKWKNTISEAVSTALKAYAPLGRYPYPSLNIVETGFNGGFGAISNITLSEKDLRGEPVGDDRFQLWVAHEVAHGWFPGLVPTAASGQGMWQESLAEFVSIWTLTAAAASAQHAKWASDVESLPKEQQKIPVVAAGWELGWPAQKALTYSKASLILTSLEQRIGHSAMLSLLQTFIRDRRGKPSTWEDIVNVVRSSSGSAEATQLDRDLKSGVP